MLWVGVAHPPRDAMHRAPQLTRKGEDTTTHVCGVAVPCLWGMAPAWPWPAVCVRFLFVWACIVPVRALRGGVVEGSAVACGNVRVLTGKAGRVRGEGAPCRTIGGVCYLGVMDQVKVVPSNLDRLVLPLPKSYARQSFPSAIMVPMKCP